MCGLTGWLATEYAGLNLRPHADAFTQRLHHRGPDATGHHLSQDNTLYLGHNRLSIIDLSSAGNQPLYSRDGDILIINGEIYNYQSLREELCRRGHRFLSNSDSEVALNAFCEWGINFTDHITGMYAIALWSEKTKTLHLLRDPMGIKPLYYWADPAQQYVLFASEISAIIDLPIFSAEINQESLRHYLEFGYSIDEQKTMVSGIHKLEPGHRLEVKQGQITAHQRFFQPDTSTKQFDSESALTCELYETLSEVVEQHMVADVPVGLLLSGGLDSSLIAAIASKHQVVNTFSMGFADSTVDERPYAKMVSEHIGSTHREFLIHEGDVMDQLKSVIGHYDDLFADWGTLSTRMLYKQCKDLGIKVVLVGEGADELFGGYPIFRTSATFSGPIEWQLFQLYRRYAGRRWGLLYPAFRTIMKRYLDDCDGDLFSAVRLFETRRQLPNNYIMKVDKASMSLGIEARTPFLDERIARLAYRIPSSQLLRPDSEKHALKQVARQHKLLPDEVTMRRKFGAGIAANWMDDSTSFRRYAADLILSETELLQRVGLQDAMFRYFEHNQSGYRAPRGLSVFRNTAWRLLLLVLWRNHYRIAL